MTSRAMIRSGIGQLSRWLGLSKYIRRVFPRASPGAGPARSAGGGKLADVTDLMLPGFGANFRGRFPDATGHLPPRDLPPRKLWELAWIADRFEEHRLEGGLPGAGRRSRGAHLPPHPPRQGRHRHRPLQHRHRLEQGATGRRGGLRSSPLPLPAGAARPSRTWTSAARLPGRLLRRRLVVLVGRARPDPPPVCPDLPGGPPGSQARRDGTDHHRVLPRRPLLPARGAVPLEGQALFGRGLRGLTLDGPVDLHYRGDVPGNGPTVRRNVHRHEHAERLQGRAGRPLHPRRLHPVDPDRAGVPEDRPDLRLARAPRSPGLVQTVRRRGRGARGQGAGGGGGALFRKALPAADTAGDRLHCYRALVEAHVHAGQVQELHETLAECQEIAPDFPDDDDALDLIGYVAAGAGQLPLARLCWEKAAASPSALPASRLRIRINQLEAELTAGGLDSEALHLAHLVEAAWCESLDFLGAGDLLLTQLGDRYQALRRRYQLATPAARTIPTRPPRRRHRPRS